MLSWGGSAKVLKAQAVGCTLGSQKATAMSFEYKVVMLNNTLLKSTESTKNVIPQAMLKNTLLIK